MNDFFHKGRLIGTGICVLLFIIFVLFCYGKLSITQVQRFNQQPTVIERGAIVDRSGKPLAVQTSFYHIGVSPRQIPDIVAFSTDVAPTLEMKPEEIVSIIENQQNSSFVYIKKKIPQTVYDDLKQITDSKKYNFVRYDRIPGRIYPENSLASQLIGYMGDDGNGLAGIEYSMQSTLSPEQNPDELKPVQGRNIYLTIDANLQYKLEQIATQAMKDTQAECLMLIAAEAKTGEILSYISLPSVNLNEYNYATSDETVDRPAMAAYEPGSVFKIFTVATAYDIGAINASDSFFCDGMYEKKTRSGEIIRIKCLGNHGWVTARDALRLSCNDALGQISDRIDENTFISKIRQLGFGSRTGIELPGETAGSVKSPESKLWSERSKPTIAIGQEIGVSALQMVQASTAITNHGVPIKLTVIHRITNKDGSVYYEHQPQYKDRIFKRSTADYILSCMETTATTGTGSRANLGDISIGVKTGTAQMADKVHGGYSKTDFLSNCIAVFPVEDPQIVLYIVIEKAKGETYAGRIVAPVIGKAADTIIDHLGMSRGRAASLVHNGRITIPGNEPFKLGKTVPDLTGMSKRDLLPLLENNNIQITITGTGWVTSQFPAPGTPITENMTIELHLE
jgi:cell division protein FtsI (penicillin-binding protein 3)